MTESVQQLIAIDFGLKRIGVAAGNTLSNTAEALKTIQLNDPEQLPAELVKLIHEWQPHKIIMGIPYNADGSEAKMGPAIKAFASLLGNTLNTPVEFIDESFSSHEANMQLKLARQTGSKNKRVQKGDLDKIAAAIMLQRWLDLGVRQKRMQNDHSEE